MRRVIRLMVNDGPMFASDTRLEAFDPGKQLALVSAWTGELRPLLDTYLQSFELTTPLTNGHPAFGALDLGKTYLGEFQRRSTAASLQSGVADASEGRVDLTEVNAAVRQHHTALGTVPFDSRKAHDSAQRLRHAAATVSGSAGTRDSSGSPHPMVRGYSRPHGNGSCAVTPAMVQQAADKHWASPAGRTPTADSSPALRPRVPIRQSDAIARMQAQHHAHWAARR